MVNPDEVARGLSPEAPEAIGDEAARLADTWRRDLAARGVSFCMETVFSDPHGAKLGFLKECQSQGYFVTLIFIGLDNADLSRGRVMERVEAGGHDVPDEKILTRFPRTFTNPIPYRRGSTVHFARSGCVHAWGRVVRERHASGPAGGPGAVCLRPRATHARAEHADCTVAQGAPAETIGGGRRTRLRCLMYCQPFALAQGNARRSWRRRSAHSGVRCTQQRIPLATH